MKVIFISGKYRDIDKEAVDRNIEKAKEASIQLWGLGWASFCPQLNTAHFDGLCDDKVWLQGDLEIVDRLRAGQDAIFALDNWETSEGAKQEIEFAKTKGLTIYYEVMGYPTPSGGILKKHHCKDFFWVKNDLYNERICSKCGVVQEVKPITTNPHSFPHQFARIK